MDEIKYSNKFEEIKDTLKTNPNLKAYLLCAIIFIIDAIMLYVDIIKYNIIGIREKTYAILDSFDLPTVLVLTVIFIFSAFLCVMPIIKNPSKKRKMIIPKLVTILNILILIFMVTLALADYNYNIESFGEGYFELTFTFGLYLDAILNIVSLILLFKSTRRKAKENI